MKSKKKYDRVIMFTNGAIGDFLMAILFLDSIKKILPWSEFIIITPRNIKILEELLLAYPKIKAVEINRHNLSGLFFLFIKSVYARTIVFDSVSFGRVYFGVRLISRFFAIFPASRRLAFSYGKNLINSENNKTLFDYKKSIYENIVSLFNKLDFDISFSVPVYNFILDKGAVERNGLEKSSYIVVHPCASNSARSLPVERWRKIIEYIINNFSDMKVAITGSKKDLSFIKDILSVNKDLSSIVNLAGKLSMPELTNIINESNGFVGVDTGISHLAGVLHKKSLIIGNLSNPSWLPFYNKNAIILVNDKNCTCDGKKGGDCFYLLEGKKYYKCMIDIPQEFIYKNIKNILLKD